MASDAQKFLEHVEGLLGREASSFHKLPATRPGFGAMSYCVFDDCPEVGSLTAVTLGLSLSDHPEWRHGRAELMISVDSADPAWGFAIADIAEVHRGEWSFCYGTTINFHQRISKESEMSGFVIFAPSLPTMAMDQQQARVELSQFPVFLKGMYPIYDGEAALIQRIGLERFWKLDGFDPWDVRRPDLSKRHG